MTTSAYNVVLPLAAAIVTEEGGLFSHAAILARELGIPAVVGVPGLLAAIGDGDIVEVDADLGEVRRLPQD
jgi:pyruvate,water dikinase